MTFDKKAWVDAHVIAPGLLGDLNEASPLQLYSFLWNGEPPKDVLVFLLAGRTRDAGTGTADPEGAVDGGDDGGWAAVARAAAAAHRIDGEQLAVVVDGFDPTAWGRHTKRLLAAGWHFDFTREQIMVQLGDRMVPIFGGDGAPLFGKDGMTSVRLFKKVEVDGGAATNLIVQIGCKFPDGPTAIAAVKVFFGLFDGQNAMEVVQTYAAPFGAA